MKAMQYTGYGDPSKLQLNEIDKPSLAPDQLLVQVVASSVNPIDWKLYNGSLRFVIPVKFPTTPGTDIAGEVVAKGSEVTQFNVGDKVYAAVDPRVGGAAAEYAVVTEKAAAYLPKNMSYQDAAVIPLAGLTALQSLRDKGRLHSGQRLLIVGASGGVGHIAVQLGKAMGAEVTAVCSEANIDLVRYLGADNVLNYQRQSRYVTYPGTYDVLLDAVGNIPYQRFADVMHSNSIYISILPNPSVVMRALFTPLVSNSRVVPLLVKPNGKDLSALTQLLETGKIKPIIEQSYHLDQLADAHRLSQTGRVRGKISVIVALDSSH